jgi:uncharacterized protein
LSGIALRSLYDVNILIALFDPHHLRHEQVLRWHELNAQHGWASCPITQNGLIRVMSQTKYSNPQSLRDMLGVVQHFSAHASHQFWADDISAADPTHINPEVALTPSMLTDAYLLALAVKNNGRLITLDSRISHTAVVGARDEHLLYL